MDPESSFASGQVDTEGHGHDIPRPAAGEKLQETRSLHISGILPGTTAQELCYLANAFGPIESLIFQIGNSVAFINFVRPEDASKMYHACCAQPCYVGQAHVGVHFAQPPLQDQALRDHIQQGATRNLHISNYGFARPEDIEARFKQFANVVEFVSKGSYSFVNTDSVGASIHAKNSLQGAIFGDKPIKISFAKEPRSKCEPGAQLPNMFIRPHSRYSKTNSSFPISQTRNLHVTNFGDGTTQAELEQLFGQYTELHAIVMKNGYAFVNTCSVDGAQHAMSSLQNQSVRGQQLKIGFAKDPSFKAPAVYNPYQHQHFGHQQLGPDGWGSTDSDAANNSSRLLTWTSPSSHTQGMMQSAVSEQKQQADMTAGSTPSRNLYVSGFGAQTSAQEIKDMFAEYCEVIDVIVKGKFAFVNTMSMEGAAAALQKLQGVSLGGSTIRVRYAKDLHALSSRNLHVTGFTANEETKQQLCDLFSKHCSVFDVFVKQKYAFVNTESPEGAAKAMEELQDAPFDGGRLVINYAKDRRTQVAPQQYDIQPGLMVLNQAPPVWQYPQMQMQLQGQAGYQQPVYQLASNSQPQFQPQMYAMPHQAAQEAQVEPTAMAPEAFAAREQYDQNL